MRHLHKHGIPLALATGSGSAEFELKIDKHRDLFNLFLVRKCNLTIHLNSSQYIFNLDTIISLSGYRFLKSPLS